MLSLLKETHIKVTQDGQNRANTKKLASIKYSWFLATPLAVDLRVG